MAESLTREDLERWVEAFCKLGYPSGGEFRVLEQDGADGANTGLVGVQLADEALSAYVQPVFQGSATWVVTLEPNEDPLELDPAAVTRLAGELSTVSALCAYLQAKSHEADSTD